MTNREFAEKDPVFASACLAAGLPFEKAHGPKAGRPQASTTGRHDLVRQASKWRRGRGLAWQHRPWANMDLGGATEVRHEVLLP